MKRFLLILCVLLAVACAASVPRPSRQSGGGRKLQSKRSVHVRRGRRKKGSCPRGALTRRQKGNTLSLRVIGRGAMPTPAFDSCFDSRSRPDAGSNRARETARE